MTKVATPTDLLALKADETEKRTSEKQEQKTNDRIGDDVPLMDEMKDTTADQNNNNKKKKEKVLESDRSQLNKYIGNADNDYKLKSAITVLSTATRKKKKNSTKDKNVVILVDNRVHKDDNKDKDEHTDANAHAHAHAHAHANANEGESAEMTTNALANIPHTSMLNDSDFDSVESSGREEEEEEKENSMSSGDEELFDVYGVEQSKVKHQEFLSATNKRKRKREDEDKDKDGHHALPSNKRRKQITPQQDLAS
ncbi:heat shock protein 86 family protein, partial [Reticulomyxa filosa]